MRLDLPARPMSEGILDRGRSYWQGMSQPEKDYADGHRDALRVINGMEPVWEPYRTVTAAYRQGWTLAVTEKEAG